MNVTFVCPSCERTSRAELAPARDQLSCSACGTTLRAPADAFKDGELTRCLVCPSNDLFVRKDFPQRLGVAIVIAGFAVSCVTWHYQMVLATFAVLFATAAVDFVLFLVMRESLVCYACGAEYRNAGAVNQHGAFDLETHERHRQHKARLAEAVGRQNASRQPT